MRAEDGSHLAHAANARCESLCDVCGGALGTEQWWVTRYPQGVHTRCRDWTCVGFPSRRHRTLLGRLRRSLDGRAREMVILADDWLRDVEKNWPAPGAEGVIKSSELMRRLRTRLVELGVQPRVTNQL